MDPAPPVVVLDVNETLSDTGPLAEVFAAEGIPAHLADLWFATVLRDGFALTATGTPRSFAAVGADALATVVHSAGVRVDLDAAREAVLGAVARLPLHPDVVPGVRELRRRGVRLAALTNGSRATVEQLLTPAGIAGEFEALLTVEDADGWKPAASSYGYAQRRLGVGPGGLLLAAVHPWDVHGAAAAGWRTAWIDRTGAPYPRSCTPPTLRATGLADLAAQLA